MKKEEASIPFRVMKKGAFAFLRRVPIEGYHWEGNLIPAPGLVIGGRESETQSPPSPWLVSVPPGAPCKYTIYAPFQKIDLLRCFSRLSTKPETIKRFADKYGWLGHPIPLVCSSSQGYIWEGESLQFWQEEIENMKFLVSLWDLVKNEQVSRLARYILWYSQPKGVLFHHIMSGRTSYSWIASEKMGSEDLLRHWKYGEVIEPTHYYLCKQINEKLQGHVNPAILPFLNGEIYMFPDCLLSALYVLFALEVSGREYPAIVCDGCGEYFTPRDRRQRYHSPSCRKLAYYHRSQSKSKA